MVWDWPLEDKITVIFYALVILLLFLNRKKFEFQAKIIALYRTKFGVNFINKYAEKHRELLKLLGYIGIGVGFVGMIFALWMIGHGLFTLFAQPEAPATFSLVVPGVNIPGSAFRIPLWVIIPLFIVVVIHESGHGLVAKAHKIMIKNTGFVFFGPIAGAFVEPDEKALAKKDDVVEYSVFAAGPFANILTAVIVTLILSFIFIPLVPIPFAGNTGSLTSPYGFSATAIPEGLPAANAGLVAGAVYDTVNGVHVNSTLDLYGVMSSVTPGQNITIGNSTHMYMLTTVDHPDDPLRGYIGITGIQTVTRIADGVSPWVYYSVKWLGEFFFWIYALSLGLGLVNLLPLGPVDGGRMIRLAFLRVLGEKKGTAIWAKIGFVLLAIILILILLPIFKALF